MMTTAWPWLTLALLGAYHGINPAMGWLFAVALGLQERRRAGVLRAIPPIALGHAGAVALAVVLGTLLLVIMYRSNTYDQGTYAIIFCFGVGPFFLLTVALYLYSRSREDRLAAEAEEAEVRRGGQAEDA